MPLLGSDEPLPRRPQRVLVAGTSGSGKTTLSGRIATLLDIEHVEIDALYHGSDWTPRDQFLADVRAFSSQPLWVTEWQYDSVRDLLADEADLLVWLDLSRFTVTRQVTARTVRRRLRREVLWNDNIEPPLHTIFFNRNHIIRWAWNTHPKTERNVSAIRHRRPDLTVVRLQTHSETEEWIKGPLRSAASL